jgi:AraC-like DNA-binding protein
MKTGIDIVKKYPEIMIIHHNLPGKAVVKKNIGVHHLILPLSGLVKVKTLGRSYRFGPGKMIYIPSDCPHEFESSRTGSGERIVALIQDSFWSKSTGKKLAPTLMSNNSLVKELLLHLLINTKTAHHQALSATLVNIIEELIYTVGDQSFGLNHLFAKTSDERVKRALEYISQNSNLKLSMTDVSKISGMSSRNLNRLFSESFGVNPKQLHNKLRMERAAEILKSKKMNVTEVCFEVGFESLSQFIKAFKKTTGKLPSEV